MKNKDDGLPKGVRKHKSGKLIVDICVNGRRCTQVFATLEQAVAGRAALKAALDAWAYEAKLERSQKIMNAKISHITEAKQNYGWDASATPAPAVSHSLTFPLTGQTVRTVVIEGDVWFVARDVAGVLGYELPTKAIIDHCKHAKTLKGSISAPLTASPRGINVIPESDVYRLVMRSKLPSAEVFQDWVVEEALPSLRQHGHYGHTPAAAPAPALASSDELPQVTLSRALIIAHKTMTEQQAALDAAKPIIEEHDKRTYGGTLYPFKEAARALQVDDRLLRYICRKYDILQRELVACSYGYESQYRWRPTAKALEKGFARNEKIKGYDNYGFTPLGMEWLKGKI